MSNPLPKPNLQDVDDLMLVVRLRARTFSRWESDIQAVMDYEDEDCLEAADAIERLTRERDEAMSDSEKFAREWSSEHARALAAEAELALAREALGRIVKMPNAGWIIARAALAPATMLGE